MKIKNLHKSCLAVIAILISNAAMAQLPSINKQEVRIGYSDGLPFRATTFLVDIFSACFSAELNNYGIEDIDARNTGFFEAGYRYQISRRFKVGADISFMNAQLTIHTNDPANKISKTSTQYLLFLPGGQFSYVKRPRLDFYASASAGIIAVWSKDEDQLRNNVGAAFQVNPVGLRVGGRMAGFIEAGFGYKGILTGGISYRF